MIQIFLRKKNLNLYKKLKSDYARGFVGIMGNFIQLIAFHYKKQFFKRLDYYRLVYALISKEKYIENIKYNYNQDIQS